MANTPKPARPPKLELEGIRQVVARSLQRMQPKRDEVVYCYGYVQVSMAAWLRLQQELVGLSKLAAPEKVPEEDEG